MTLRCFLSGHVWRPHLAPEMEFCLRCVRTRPIVPRLPAGAEWCPYPDCKGWVPRPPRPAHAYTGSAACDTCQRPHRWERALLAENWAGPYVTHDRAWTRREAP